MDTITTSLTVLPLILFAVVMVTAVAENINIPYPLLLIVAGLIVGFIPHMPSWQPSPDLALTLFLPPILFAAARTTSWHDIKHNTGTILSLSFGLVIFTTLTVAAILYFLIPNMHFSTALVLGAIVSPTDIVAANSILSRMNINRKIIRTIRVESLFNDASGIVLYKTALLLVAGQSMHVGAVAHHIFLMGIGGIVVGLALAYFIGFIIKYFLTNSENDIAIIMSLILAYITFIFAEKLGVSGVLAVVAAGLYHKKTERCLRANTRLAAKTVWDMLIFFLNGLIFIAIGLQFPYYLKTVSSISTTDLIAFSTITIVSLLLLRFIWVIFNECLTYGFKRFLRRNTGHSFPWKKVVIVSWSGMRGLVALALAIAIPFTLPDDSPFPARDLIIFLTIITILFTLLMQGLTLPGLISYLKASKDQHDEFRIIRNTYQQLSKTVLNQLGTLLNHPQDSSEPAKDLITSHYANRLLGLHDEHTPDKEQQEHHQKAALLLARTLQYERDLLLKMRQRGEIGEEIYIKILHKLDHDEVSFSAYK